MPHSSTSLRISHLFSALRPTTRRFFTTSPNPRDSEGALPTIQTCPAPGCTCAPMPEGLAIDYERQMSETMPPYAQHVIIRTGRNDWSSRIEDEPHTLGTQAEGGLGGGNLARTLKELVGRGGKYHNPSHPVLITNSSLLRGSRLLSKSNYHALELFPENFHFPKLANKPEIIEDFAYGFLGPRSERLARNKDRAGQQAGERRSGLSHESEVDETGRLVGWEGERLMEGWRQIRPTRGPIVLICGHMSRDSRCGIMGPILKAEFDKNLKRSVTTSLSYTWREGDRDGKSDHPLRYTSVGLCSHVGGHAFAGNVVIYLPKNFRSVEGGDISPLAGRGIWYGRVEPRHVEGIVEETMKGGRLIQELLRGVHDPS